MSLKSKLVPLVMALLIVAAPAASFADAGTLGQQITLSDAITMAQNSNVGLVISNITLQQAKNSESSASTGFASSGSFTPGSNGNSSQINAATGKLSSAYTLQNDLASNAYQQNNVIYETESAYFAVQDAVYGAQVAQTSVDQAQQAYNDAEVSYQQGVETANDLATAKSNLDLAKSKLTAAQAGVDAAYVNFDNTVGLDPTERPDLTTLVSYDPNYVAGVVSADQAVSQTLANNYQALTAQNNVFLADSEQAYANPSTNGYLNYQQAQLAEQQAIQGLTISARAAYMAVGSDTDAYNAAEKAVISAQASYSNAQASYAAGVITKSTLLQAELGLVSAKQTLQSDLHSLLLARANLALITGVGSVTIPVSSGQ